MAIRARFPRSTNPFAPLGRRFFAPEESRQTAFLASSIYVLLVFLGLNALFGWTLWPWLKVVAPAAFLVGVLFTRMSTDNLLED